MEDLRLEKPAWSEAEDGLRNANETKKMVCYANNSLVFAEIRQKIVISRYAEYAE